MACASSAGEVGPVGSQSCSTVAQPANIRRSQRLAEGGEIDDALAEIAEQARGAGVIESDPMAITRSTDLGIDVLEMQIGDPVGCGAVEGHRIEARIDAVTGVETDAEQRGSIASRTASSSSSNSTKPRGMRMDGDVEAEFLGGPSAPPSSSRPSRPSRRRLQTLRLVGASGGRCRARGEIESIRTIGWRRATSSARQVRREASCDFAPIAPDRGRGGRRRRRSSVKFALGQRLAENASGPRA